MLLTIIRYTPIWVWGLLAALLALGFWQVLPRRVARGQILALPISLLCLGLWSMAPGFAAQPLSVLLWLAALVACSALGRRLPRPAGAAWHAESSRLQLPGSWLPLALIVGIFTLRYGVSVGQALNPELRQAAAVLLPVSVLYGAISGLLLGRALGLLQLTRPAPATMTRHEPARSL